MFDLDTFPETILKCNLLDLSHVPRSIMFDMSWCIWTIYWC